MDRKHNLMDQRLNGSGAPARHVLVGAGNGDIAGKAEVGVAAWSPATPPFSRLQKYATKAEEYAAAEGCSAGAREDSECQ